MRKVSFFQVGAAVSFLALMPLASRAQSGAGAPVSEPAPATQPPVAAGAAQPKDATSGAPVPSQAPAPNQSRPASTPDTKPAKVWTNDEVNVLRGSVSVVGKNGQQGTGASAKPKGYSMEKDPNWYRKQLQPLQAEIDKLNGQIEKTKAFLNGERVNDGPPSNGAYWGAAGNPQVQLRKFEEQRDKDVAKVNDLLDRARHNDIPPGDLR